MDQNNMFFMPALHKQKLYLKPLADIIIRPLDNDTNEDKIRLQNIHSILSSKLKPEMQIGLDEAYKKKIKPRLEKIKDEIEKALESSCVNAFKPSRGM